MNAAPFTVALLGGESTGKSQLTEALQSILAAPPHGWQCVVVSEHLREWCQAHGRAPRMDEQAALAAEQTRRIAHARAIPAVQVVLADTTALMLAAYSEQYFNDTTLWSPALAEHRSQCDLTLLMGLDLPWVPDGLFRDSPEARQHTDALLRRQLERAGVAFQTIYGHGPQRVQQALRTMGAAMGVRLVESDPASEQGRRPWTCEKCSDPECEHRLFRDLIAQRPAR